MFDFHSIQHPTHPKRCEQGSSTTGMLLLTGALALAGLSGFSALGDSAKLAIAGASNADAVGNSSADASDSPALTSSSHAGITASLKGLVAVAGAHAVTPRWAFKRTKKVMERVELPMRIDVQDDHAYLYSPMFVDEVGFVDAIAVEAALKFTEATLPGYRYEVRLPTSDGPRWTLGVDGITAFTPSQFSQIGKALVRDFPSKRNFFDDVDQLGSLVRADVFSVDEALQLVHEGRYARHMKSGGLSFGLRSVNGSEQLHEFVGVYPRTQAGRFLQNRIDGPVVVQDGNVVVTGSNAPWSAPGADVIRPNATLNDVRAIPGAVVFEEAANNSFSATIPRRAFLSHNNLAQLVDTDI